MFNFSSSGTFINAVVCLSFYISLVEHTPIQYMSCFDVHNNHNRSKQINIAFFVRRIFKLTRIGYDNIMFSYIYIYYKFYCIYARADVEHVFETSNKA